VRKAGQATKTGFAKVSSQQFILSPAEADQRALQ